MESYSRVRTIKLKRKSLDDPFGFTVRGGQEHGTGVFVSSVTPKSTAHRQGLKTGDQILRVNGYPVSSATHMECLAVMKFRTNLHLKIRSVGMIPVQEPGEPLTWRLVENIHSATLEVVHIPKLSGRKELTPDPGSGRAPHHPLMSRMSDTSSQAESHDHGQEAKIYINTNGNAGLGCCICRGPPERPGIFVQSTKSSGVAREAGLRPGDQILECNGHSFTGVQFPEAVYYLKASKELRLVVIKGAASDLFPGESSGYNSSASSINGETITTRVSVESESSSCHSEIHVDEVSHGDKVLNRASPPTGDEATVRSRVVLDRNMEWDEVEQVWHSAAAHPIKESLIIEIKGEDPVEQIRNEELRLSQERRKLEEEQRRLIEDAKRLEEEKGKFEEEKRKALEQAELASRSSSASSNELVTRNTRHPDLAGALSNEILKRSERRELQQQMEVEGKEEVGEKKVNGTFMTPADDAKRQQHEQLIEEFKRAHRKMFAHSIEDINGSDKNGGPPREERASFRAKRIQKEVEHTRKMVQNCVAGIVRQRQFRIERQHQEVQETEREVVGKGKPKAPPPPPPELGDRKSIVPASKISSRVQQSTNKVPGTRSISSTQDKKVLTEEPVRIRGKTIEPNEISERPESPSPDYSNTPSPEIGRRPLGGKTFAQVTGHPPPVRHHLQSESQNRDLENAVSRCHLTSNDRGKSDRGSGGRGVSTILIKAAAPQPQKHKMNSAGGILKKSSTSGSEQGGFKTISFGKF